MCHETKNPVSLSYCRSDTHSLHLSECFLLSFQHFTYSLVTHLCKTPHICIDKPTTNQSFCACPPPLHSTNWLITYTKCALTLESLSSSDDDFDPTTGHRSLTWLHPHYITNSVFSLHVARSHSDVDALRL